MWARHRFYRLIDFDFIRDFLSVSALVVLAVFSMLNYFRPSAAVLMDTGGQKLSFADGVYQGEANVMYFLEQNGFKKAEEASAQSQGRK